MTSSALAVHDDGNIELDGDVAYDGDPLTGVDWEDVYTECGLSGSCEPIATGAQRQFFGDDSAANDPTAFKGGMKDTLPISSWQCTTTTPQGKSDIQYAYGAVFDSPEGKLLYTGTDRRTVDGTAYFGIWLLQQPASCISAGGVTPFTGRHEDGDLLLVAELTGGGSVSTINTYRWTDPDLIPENGDECLGGDRGPIGDECVNAGLTLFQGVNCLSPDLPNDPIFDSLCGITNSPLTEPNGVGPITASWRATEIGENGFYEAGINLSAFSSASVNLTDCFSSVLIETRSSASLTASLKDFTIVDLATCGSITVEKETNVPPGDLFNFTVSPAAGVDDISNFQLQGGDSILISSVETETYTLTEGALPSEDWSRTSISCTEGGANANLETGAIDVTVGTADDIVCTFVNELAPPPGTLVISKSCDTTTANTDSWDFTITGPEGSLEGSTTLDCQDGAVTLACGESIACEALLPGAHTVNEDNPAQAPWRLTGVNCVGGASTDCAVANTPDATVTIGEQEGIDDSVAVAFTNTEDATITVTKLTVPAGVGGDFAFTSDLGAFSLAHGETETFNNVIPATGYAFSETPAAGFTISDFTCSGTNWSADGLGAVTVTPDAGETVSCTVTNTQNPGSITICKETIPDGAAGSFPFELDGPAAGLPVSEDLVDDECTTAEVVPVGTGYSITETVPVGWDLTSASCSDESPVDNISVSADEAVICTFTNTQRGRIRVVKTAVGGDDTFPFVASWGDFSIATTGGTGENLSDWLVPGDYTIAEGTLPAGWEATGVTCDDDDGDDTSLNLDPGEEITCTFTNTALGSITVIKNTIGADGTFDFTRDFGADFEITTTGNTGQIVFGDLSPGPYSLAESDPGPGWNLDSATCTGDMDPSEITLAPAGAVVCTFTNDKLNPAISIEKSPDSQSVSPGATASWTIEVTNTGEVALENVVVTDDLAPDCAADIGDLGIGESTSYDCSLDNVQAAFTNVADVTGDPIDGGDPVQDSDDADVDLLTPSISITKSPGSQSVLTGGTAEFDIVVTNTGNIDLENVVVTDTLAPDCSADIGDLGIGESTSYSCSLANVQAAFTNVADVIGDPVDGGDPVEDSDTARVAIIIPTVSVPVNSPWALLLLILSIIGIAWYRRPARL